MRTAFVDVTTGTSFDPSRVPELHDALAVVVVRTEVVSILEPQTGLREPALVVYVLPESRMSPPPFVMPGHFHG